MSRDRFLIALSDCVDGAELALDRGGGELDGPAREALARALRDLLAHAEAADFLGAEEGLTEAEHELRERLRDLVLDELPEYLDRLPPAPAAVDDPEALARVLVMREVVLPELDVALPRPTPTPPVGQGRSMFSFASLRPVGLVAILVGLALSRMPGPRSPHRPPLLPASMVERSETVRLPLLLRLPDGTEVAPRALSIAAETAGLLVEGVTTLSFDDGLPLGGGAVVESIPPRNTRIVGFRWAGRAAVPAEPLEPPRYQRGRRSPLPEDPLHSWRRRAALPPFSGGGPIQVQVIWRGVVGRGRTRHLEIPLEGLTSLDQVEIRIEERRPEVAAIPGWLEEASPTPASVPLPQVHRLENLEAPGRLRVPLRMRPPGPVAGLWRWGPRQVLVTRLPPRTEGRFGLSEGDHPRYEVLVDTSAAGAPLAAERLALLRGLAQGGGSFQGQVWPTRPLGAPTAPTLPLAKFSARLEAAGFLGPRPPLELPPEGAGMLRILVLQGPGVPPSTIAAAAELGPVVLLGAGVDPSLFPGRFPVQGLELGRDPEIELERVWRLLEAANGQSGAPHLLALAPFHGPESLLGAPVFLDPVPASWKAPRLRTPAPLPAPGLARKLGACEPSTDEQVSLAEPELIFGADRQDPAFVGSTRLSSPRPSWVLRELRPAPVAPPAPGSTDRFVWEQSLQEPRAEENWAEVRARAEAWRRADPRNPWPLLYLAEAAVVQRDPALLRRALGGVPLLSDDPAIRRVALALALGAGDAEAVRGALQGAPPTLTAKLDRARAEVILAGPVAAGSAYRELAEASYVQALAGTAPMSFAVAARAEARVIEARAAGRAAPGIFASLEPAGSPDCLALRLLDRTGEEARVSDGETRGGGRLTSGVAGPVAWARMRRLGDEVVLGFDPGTPGPDGVARGVLVLLRPGVPGFDVRLVVAGSGPARVVHREVLAWRKGSR